MSKFNIGDRVQCIESYQGGIHPGECGVVICHDNYGRAGVELDDYLKGRHGLSGRVNKGHGWWVPEECLRYEELRQDFGELPVLDITSIYKI